jgi:hypothetical protein
MTLWVCPYCLRVRVCAFFSNVFFLRFLSFFVSCWRLSCNCENIITRAANIIALRALSNCIWIYYTWCGCNTFFSPLDSFRSVSLITNSRWWGPAITRVLARADSPSRRSIVPSRHRLARREPKKKNNNLMNFSRCSYKMGGLIVFVPYVCTIVNIKKRYKRRDEILQWREHQDDFNRITEPNEWID